MLEKIDFDVSPITKDEYKPLHDELVKRLIVLQQEAKAKGIGLVVLFEGWNGAGKGGRISDLLYNLDARYTSVYVTPNYDVKSAKKFKNAHITDTDESHYPYAADFSVAGMSCENCARNVTNALDSIDGTWATVDLEGRTAHVLSKNPIDAAAYKSVVSEAGYRIVA